MPILLTFACKTQLCSRDEPGPRFRAEIQWLPAVCLKMNTQVLNGLAQPENVTQSGIFYVLQKIKETLSIAI
jgi:hypothetical protein